MRLNQGMRATRERNEELQAETKRKQRNVETGIRYREIFRGFGHSSRSTSAFSRRNGGGSGAGSSGDGSGFQAASNRGLRQASGMFDRVGRMAGSMAGKANMFKGVTNDYISAVKGYNPQFLVDQAAMDARSSYDKSKGILQRNMERYGINPNSGRFASMQSDWARALAAAEAGAKTKARRQVYLDRISVLGNAASMGNSLSSSALSGMSNAAQGQMGVSGRWGELAGDQAALSGYTEERSSFQDQVNSMFSVN